MQIYYLIMGNISLKYRPFSQLICIFILVAAGKHRLSLCLLPFADITDIEKKCVILLN